MNTLNDFFLSVLVSENPCVEFFQHRTDFVYLESVYEQCARMAEGLVLNENMNGFKALEIALQNDFGWETLKKSAMENIEKRTSMVMNHDHNLMKGF